MNSKCVEKNLDIVKPYYSEKANDLQLNYWEKNYIFLVITPTYCGAGAPGQLMNWMPAPQAPMGCPPGLEYLSAIDQVLVQQQIELLEGITL